MTDRATIADLDSDMSKLALIEAEDVAAFRTAHERMPEDRLMGAIFESFADVSPVQTLQTIATVSPPNSDGDTASGSELTLSFATLDEARNVLGIAKRLGLQEGEVRIDTTMGNGYAVRLAPHVRYQRNDVVTRLLRELREGGLLTVENDTALETFALIEVNTRGPLGEVNPLHSPDSGEFASKGELGAKGKGSYSLASSGRSKRKVSGAQRGKKGEGPVLKWDMAQKPCGRDARKAGLDQKCSEAVGTPVSAIIDEVNSSRSREGGGQRRGSRTGGSSSDSEAEGGIGEDWSPEARAAAAKARGARLNKRTERNPRRFGMDAPAKRMPEKKGVVGRIKDALTYKAARAK